MPMIHNTRHTTGPAAQSPRIHHVDRSLTWCSYLEPTNAAAKKKEMEC